MPPKRARVTQSTRSSRSASGAQIEERRRGSRASARETQTSSVRPGDASDNTLLRPNTSRSTRSGLSTLPLAESSNILAEGSESQGEQENSDPDGGTVPQTQDLDGNNGENQDPNTLSEDDRQFLITYLPDLQKATDELMQKIESDPKTPLQQRFLKIKQQAFYAAMEHYVTGTSNIIDTTRFARFGRDTEKMTAALARANLVSTLDKTKKDGDLLPVLEQFDNMFIEMFEPLGIGALNVELALELRTQCFIIAFAQNKAKEWFEGAEWILLLAALFCKGIEGINNIDEVEPLLVNGPFRELCGSADNNVAKMVAARIDEITSLITDDKNDSQKKLSEKYPVDDFLQMLEEWVIEEFDNASNKPIARPEADLESQPAPVAPRDGGGAVSITESIDTADESQPIQRFQPDMPSLYMNETSLAALRSPQATQDAGPSASRKSDHAHLLLSPSVTAARTAHQEADDDDEDDVFESNPRTLDNRKRAALDAELERQLPKRPRQDARSTAPQSSFARTQQQPPGSAYNNPNRRRHPWSDKDSLLLIELIARFEASWTKIQDEAHSFERHHYVPIGQVALKDRARNMKVDMLLTDMRLPKKFDLVRLGRKEEMRIMKSGKNPYRKEEHVDKESGRPFNTEYGDSARSNNQ